MSITLFVLYCPASLSVNGQFADMLDSKLADMFSAPAFAPTRLKSAFKSWNAFLHDNCVVPRGTTPSLDTYGQ